MLKVLRFLLPLIIFCTLVMLLWKGLAINPRLIPSPLINKPVPAFTLPNLNNPQQQITEKELHGHITLLNIWASWCVACRDEHPILIDIAQQKDKLQLFGIDYKDNPEQAKNWLQEHGNPYQKVVADSQGNLGIDLGVYGIPETFIVDQQGVIRYKHIGKLTSQIWQNELLPIIQKLEK